MVSMVAGGVDDCKQAADAVASAAGNLVTLISLHRHWDALPIVGRHSQNQKYT